MSVHAAITLRKDVTDLDKADDWYDEIKELLEGKTTCSFFAHATNPEPVIQIEKDPDDG